jgi:two-component system sensor histidine kinase TctE
MPFPREQRSLFGEILDWMLAPLLLLWPMSVVLTWLVAQGIADKPYDRQLGEMARMLAQQVTVNERVNDRATARFSLPTGASELLRSDEADTVYYQVLGPRGELLAGDQTLPLPSAEGGRKTGQVLWRDEEFRNESVRVAYLWVDTAGAGSASDDTEQPLVQVAETLGKRSRLATEIAKGVMLPHFVILPVAVLLVWLALARGIAPLNELQQRIRLRPSHDLSPIDEREVPEEVSPLVRAINDLLARLDGSIRSQKHFLADAAHQLKTPLAGLRTQAELIQREIDAGERDPAVLKKSLRQIALASQRAAHMVNQLLSMASAEDTSQVIGHQPVNLARLAADTVRDFVPRALEKNIDLGYEGPDAQQRPALLVRGRALLLRELIRNLVDNALQYTPQGGTVTVRVMSDPFGQVVVLQVEDTGPGIPAAERELVFQPFYRALGTDVDGSGLGLAIVREIAQRHGADITLDDAQPRHRSGTTDAMPLDPGPGARFTLRFAADVTPQSVSTASALPSSASHTERQPGPS